MIKRLSGLKSTPLPPSLTGQQDILHGWMPYSHLPHITTWLYEQGSVSQVRLRIPIVLRALSSYSGSGY